MPNPLDAFASRFDVPADFRIPDMPKLSEALSKAGFKDGLVNHEKAMEQWRQNVERAIVERLQGTTTTATATTTAAATTPTTPSAPSSPSTPATPSVVSVNGKTGAVVLGSDDITEGATNLYLTQARWQDLFDHFGFLSNVIPAGQSVTIGTDRNAVIYGGLTVTGQLTIAGHLKIL